MDQLTICFLHWLNRSGLAKQLRGRVSWQKWFCGGNILRATIEVSEFNEQT
jgi:hypothetical protein